MALETAVRLGAVLRENGADLALLTAADEVCHATGIPVPIETGASPFAGGPTTALVDTSGAVTRIAINLEPDPALSPVHRTLLYPGFSLTSERLVENYLATIEHALGVTPRGTVVAVDPVTLPASVARLLDERDAVTIDLSNEFRRVRAVKTPEELSRLRTSAEVAATAQREAVTRLAESIDELHLFAALRLAAERTAGHRVPFTGDLVSGIDRTAAVGGGPTTRHILAGEPVIADLAPRVEGYWADSSNTFLIGEPTPALASMHSACASALQAGMAAARPGITASALDTAVRSVLHKHGFTYPHHTGHGIGTSVHEWPRIVPGEHGVLEENMVILLEPGAYKPGVGGVRLEWMFQVSATGLDLLTHFPHNLSV